MPWVTRITNHPAYYGWGAILLHWLMASGIFALYGLGLYLDTLSYYDPAYRTLPHLHKSGGVLLAGLLVVRLIWRACNPVPQSLSNHRRWEHLAARLGHASLYLILASVLASGYLISTADGRPISVFGWFNLPALPATLPRQEDLAGTLHFWAATTLIGLAALHALAALKHHWFDRDSTLKRMLGLKEKT